MVLKLYARKFVSGGTAIVALVLAEKQIPFELVEIDIQTNQNKTPEYLALHPFGQIPCIDDDGFVLYESRAICRYLCEKYPDQGAKELYPTGFKERALVEQAASVESANFIPYVSRIFRELLFKPLEGQETDQSSVDEALALLHKKLDAYEVILGKTKYLAGDVRVPSGTRYHSSCLSLELQEFTLADLFHLYAAPRLTDLGVDVWSERGPNVRRWWDDISTRPAWLKLRAEGVKGTTSTD
ncbi:thioredoxin-like protein [Roridomyces roridus]|uniref:glutathione transferase n=1 Tax=Roridomyces roridus TaxID=1738132 RepID=A0AAD7C8M3_9AGAR|nr:thioredoxin-like protein [Roridomyces roridus]